MLPCHKSTAEVHWQRLVIYGSVITQQLSSYTIIVEGQWSKKFTSSYSTVVVMVFPMLRKPHAGERARDESLGLRKTLFVLKKKGGEEGLKESSQQEVFYPSYSFYNERCFQFRQGLRCSLIPIFNQNGM